jgi:hypothetical protein
MCNDDKSALPVLSSNDKSDYYSKFVKPDQINKKQIVKTKEGKEEIIFLGTIKNKRGHVLFYVLTVFSEVQAVITVHGHSNIIYLDTSKKFKRQYNVGLPEELPFRLEKNALHFHFIDAKTKKKKVFINNVGIYLPKIMCVEPDNCY